MQIALLSGTYPPMYCGVGDYTAKLAQALAARGHAVHVLTSREATDGSSGRGVTVHRLVDEWSLGGVLPVLRILRQLEPDAISLQYPTAAYGRRAGILLLSTLINEYFRSASRVITVHEYHDTTRLGRLGALLTGALFPKVLATNTTTASLLTRRMRGAVSLIPIGSNVSVSALSPEERDQARRRYAEGRQHLLLYFGFVAPSKGVDRLLEAVEMLGDVRLVIATSFDKDNAYHQSLRQKVNALGEGRVAWTGLLDDTSVSELLQVSDLLVLPFDDPATIRRGSLVAGLVHGTPTLTTGPLTSPLLNEVNCIAIGTQPHEIAAAVARVLGDRTLQAELRAGAAALAPQFSWDAIADRYEAALERRTGAADVSP